MDIKQAIQDKILLLDGAMGTMLQQKVISEDDFRGARFREHPVPLKGMNDILSLTQPGLIKSIHQQYLEAGAHIVTTNSFNANFFSLRRYQLEPFVREINLQAASIARESVKEYTRRAGRKDCYVAGTIGPTDKMASLSPSVDDPAYRNVHFDELVEAYYEQAKGLLDGGVDLLLAETIFDTLNAKAALFAIRKIFVEKGNEWPVMVSGTISGDSGRSLSGQTVEAFYNSLQPFSPFAIGLNCSFGPEKLLPFLERLSEKSAQIGRAHV